MPTDLKALLLDPAYRERLLAIEAAASPAPWKYTPPLLNAVLFTTDGACGDRDDADDRLSAEARNHFRAALDLIGELAADLKAPKKCDCGRSLFCDVCDDE